MVSPPASARGARTRCKDIGVGVEIGADLVRQVGKTRKHAFVQQHQAAVGAAVAAAEQDVAQGGIARRKTDCG